MSLLSDNSDVENYYRHKYSASLPKAELDFKIYEYSQNAIRTFDGSKGASFKTHLNNHLSKLQRDVHEHGSSLKTSEELGFNINKVKRAKDEFYMAHGTEASSADISKSTGLSSKLVDKYGRVSKIKTVSTDHFDYGSDDFSVGSLLPGMNKKDAIIAETITGGMSTAQAMKHTGLSKSSFFRQRESVVSNMKNAFLRIQSSKE